MKITNPWIYKPEKVIKIFRESGPEIYIFTYVKILQTFITISLEGVCGI